jgi:hypothetical protein
LAKITSKIATREQRKKLPLGKREFDALEKDVDLGCRKGKRGGS